MLRFFFLAIGLVVSSSFALSGKVVDGSGVGMAGVIVSLSGSTATATTDASGTWILSGTSGIEIRSNSREKNASRGGVILDCEHLRLSLSGFDPAGRSLSHGTLRLQNTILGSSARRIAAIPDTIFYSWAGKTFRRDTTSNLLRTGIVANFDTTSNPEVLYGWLVDSRDSLIYRTVNIGTQTWMAQNLNYQVDSSWCSPAACAVSGRIYTWAAAMDLNTFPQDSAYDDTGRHQGICPSGWHVPSFNEWNTLESVGNINLIASSGWKDHFDRAITDPYGFTALPEYTDYSVFWANTGNSPISTCRLFNHCDQPPYVMNKNILGTNWLRCLKD